MVDREDICMYTAVNFYFGKALFSSQDDLFEKNKDHLKQYKAGTLKEFTLGSGDLTRSIECDGVWYERETVRQFILFQHQKPKFVFQAIEDALKISNDNKCILNILYILSEGKGKQFKFMRFYLTGRQLSPKAINPKFIFILICYIDLFNLRKKTLVLSLKK